MIRLTRMSYFRGGLIAILLPLVGMTNLPAEPVIIAHRGACAIAPENTCSAIEKAIEMGVRVIEFDVRETSDGELVLFHDSNLKRVLGREESLEDLSWSEVKELDVGSWFGSTKFQGETPMLLRDAVTLCLEHDVTPLIEHKTGKAESYAAILMELGVVERVIVQSFNWDFLAALSTELPTLKFGALGKKELDRLKMARLKGLAPDWVGWKFSRLTTTRLESLKDEGYFVALWTVNDPDVARQWIERGVDGIITDYPDKMLTLID